MTVNTSLWVHTAKGAAPQWIRDHADYAGDDCICWPFFRDPSYGRGRIGQHIAGTSDKTRPHWAHRVMCEYVNGPPPSSKYQAIHSCGNGHLGCVNPKHLKWATNSENQSDRRRHGTHWGAKGTRTHLTREQVSEIRRLKGKETQFALAYRFGCKRGTIEYWQRTDHEPVPFSTSPKAVRRRTKSLSSH